jgi:hypothetical protein
MRLARNGSLALCVSLIFAGPAAADVISDWNVFASANIGSGRPAVIPGTSPPIGFGAVGPAGQIDLALVHLAMHDAVQAYDKRYKTYSVPVLATSGSPIVAAAKAAHDVLAARLSLTPEVVAAIDIQYQNYIAALSPAPSLDDISAGEQVGAAAASNVLTNRRFAPLLSRFEDGSFPLAGTFDQFVGGTGIGEWRPNAGTPGMVAPWLGAVRPLAIANPLDFPPDPIPALTSLEYAEAYNEVKLLGADNSPRTTEEGQIARFFSGNPFAMFNRLMRELIAEHMNGSDLASLGDHARLFALANMAAADAIITAWQCKIDFNFWRPQHAIQSGDEDGNDLTVGDVNWKPYLGTPNYPDYTSGFNNATGSMTTMIALYFGSDRPFDNFKLWLTAAPGLAPQAGDPNPRIYTRLSDVQQEVIVARVYEGIHFRDADTQARSQGKRIAKYVFRNILTPINKH